MEARPRRHGGRPSPERSKPRVESPPKHRRQLQQGRKVSVVYYLCRNGNLEHPHFVEVPVSSPDGLHLRDVIDRLVVLRGKGMPAMYSWSCKRCYKNGFVWHDLEEEDLVIPAHGNEYILKGSELLDHSPSDRLNHSTSSPQLKNPEHAQQEPPTSSRTQEASSSPYSSIFIIKEVSGRADASTQTEDIGGRGACGPGSQMKFGLTDDEPLDHKFIENSRNRTSCFIEESKNGVTKASPPATSSSAFSLVGKTETLESLIRAEVSKMNSLRGFDKEVLVRMKPKLKATNMLMQLITCGLISVKEDQHRFGLATSYKPSFSHVKLPPSMFSSLLIMKELGLSESPSVRYPHTPKPGS